MESGESIMLKIQEIREIIKLIDQSSIEKFTYESDGAKLVLKKGSSTQTAVASTVVEQKQPVQQGISDVQLQRTEEVIAPQVVAPAAVVTQVEDPSLHKITSPMVGTFYTASSPDIPAYVQKGDSVKPEAIVCIVEAMKYLGYPGLWLQLLTTKDPDDKQVAVAIASFERLLEIEEHGIAAIDVVTKTDTETKTVPVT